MHEKDFWDLEIQVGWVVRRVLQSLFLQRFQNPILLLCLLFSHYQEIDFFSWALSFNPLSDGLPCNFWWPFLKMNGSFLLTILNKNRRVIHEVWKLCWKDYYFKYPFLFLLSKLSSFSNNSLVKLTKYLRQKLYQFSKIAFRK